MITPKLYPEPADDASWQAWDLYLRSIAEVNRIEAEAIRAENTRVQQAILDAMVAPQPDQKPSRAELAMRWLDREPVTISDTVTSVFARVTQQVDAFAKAYPGALRD